MGELRTDAVEVVASLKHLRPFPVLAMRLVDMACGESPDRAELVRLVEQDPLLVAEILRTANNAHYARRVPTECVEQALLVLGNRAVAQVAAAGLIGRHLLERVEHRSIGRSLWRHALAVGAMARELAAGEQASARQAGTLGLFHELGPMALLNTRPDLVLRVEQALQQGMQRKEAEQQIYGLCGDQLSVLAARSLLLPKVLVAGLEALQRGDTTLQPAVRCVLAADRIAPLIGIPSYPSATSLPLGAATEAVLSRQSGSLKRVAQAANEAVLSVTIDEPIDPIEMVFNANRRLAELNSAYVKVTYELERRADETRKLLGTISMLQDGMDVKHLRTEILDALLRQYGASVSFELHLDSADGATGMCGVLRADDTVRQLPLKLSGAWMGLDTLEALDAGQCVDLRSGAAHAALCEAIGPMMQFVLAPMQVRNRRSGLLGLGFATLPLGDSGAMEFLAILSTAAALSIENARLYAEAVEEATVDTVTGLTTRRSALDQLQRCLLERRGESCAVIMIDLDNFKAVNDNLGHWEGDVYLKEVGAALKATLRPGDAVSRFGGDEFLVVLRHADAASAARVAERVLEALQQVAANERWLRVPAQLGASLGVACSIENDDAKSLVTRADVALYEAKALGKGRVVTAGRPVAVR
ncbi:MAG: GGDEF domain-containing protein [Planctomycetes bacterium]|nr:GGDEF domain-containing protein [Planctomycetota bacterium]